MSPNYGMEKHAMCIQKLETYTDFKRMLNKYDLTLPDARKKCSTSNRKGLVKRKSLHFVNLCHLKKNPTGHTIY